MPTSRPSEHRDEILDQFTRQATPFATAPGIRDEAALRLIVECSGAGPADTVLDVACGPGLVVAAFARVARHATGIDITPAMLERARAHAFNRMERLRDPSHVRSLPVAEHRELFARVGLPEPRVTSYRLEGELEGLIARSFPNPGDDDKIRALFRASLADDALGIQTRLEDGKIHYGFPVAVLVADR